MRALMLVIPAALFAAPAEAQPFALIGSWTGVDQGGEEWMLGGGYEIEFLAVPVSVGFMGQTGPGFRPSIGVDEEGVGRRFPARGYAYAKVGMLPTPGFRVYVGGGAGLASRFGGGAESAPQVSGLALLGIQVGRLRLETQYQRDFADEPVNQWMTALGISF